MHTAMHMTVNLLCPSPKRIILHLKLEPLAEIKFKRFHTKVVYFTLKLFYFLTTTLSITYNVSGEDESSLCTYTLPMTASQALSINPELFEWPK